MKLTPFKYQTEFVDWCSKPRKHEHNSSLTCNAYHGLCGDEMGVGKTAEVLWTIKPLVKQGKRFLILAPGATIPQWQVSWQLCIHEASLDDDPFNTEGVFAVKGSNTILPKGSSVIASHQMMAKADFVKQVAALNFDGVIIDEAHKFGGLATKRIKHLWVARNLSESKWADCCIAMTGTPVRNYAKEVFNLLHFVAPESFRNIEDFSRKYLTFDRKALWNPVQFHSDIAPFYLRRTVSQVQKDLPEHRITKLYTDITDPYIRMLYNKDLDALDNFMQNGSKLGHGSDGPQSILGYLIRLRHLTGIAKAKELAIIESMADYLTAENQRNVITASGEAVNGNKIAIGLIHKLVADRIEKSILNLVPDCKVFRIQGGMDPTEKEANKQAFISCEAPALILCNMEAGGSGIDGLQFACSKSYVFERMWNGADEVQFEKRIARTGQTFKPETQYTIANGTVDQFFDEMVEMKREITGNVEDANWATDGKALRELATRVVMHRL